MDGAFENEHEDGRLGGGVIRKTSTFLPFGAEVSVSLWLLSQLKLKCFDSGVTKSMKLKCPVVRLGEGGGVLWGGSRSVSLNP